MMSRFVALLTLCTLVGHAVFGCCLPHAHAEGVESAPVIGGESHSDEQPCHRGTNHTHLEGDSCTFVLPLKAKLPASDHTGCRHLMAAAVPLLSSVADVFSAAQNPDLSPSGLPPTRSVQDLTQVWLL